MIIDALDFDLIPVRANMRANEQMPLFSAPPLLKILHREQWCRI
jgi:hypothetical protein